MLIGISVSMRGTRPKILKNHWLTVASHWWASVKLHISVFFLRLSFLKHDIKTILKFDRLILK